jgi:hypothetical protein
MRPNCDRFGKTSLRKKPNMAELYDLLLKIAPQMRYTGLLF